MSTDVTKRFSSRVDDYVKFRPGYPGEIIGFLEKNCGLKDSSIIADIGSGTGKSAEIFLENGNRVFGVEPNVEMRHAAETLYHGVPNFVSIDGRAEKTGMNPDSIDFIVIGQAFHWFNQEEAKHEFKRILKPGGYVLIVWNERERNQVGFMGEYDDFLVQYSIDYQEIDHRNVSEEALKKFYSPGDFSLKEFDYRQVFDFSGLKGRYDSCSYAIPSDDSRYQNTILALKELFDKYQKDGKVVMEYVTKMYWGRVEK
jgi:SAM-dependent methyltransferase